MTRSSFEHSPRCERMLPCLTRSTIFGGRDSARSKCEITRTSEVELKPADQRPITALPADGSADGITQCFADAVELEFHIGASMPVDTNVHEGTEDDIDIRIVEKTSLDALLMG